MSMQTVYRIVGVMLLIALGIALTNAYCQTVLSGFRCGFLVASMVYVYDSRVI